eukprot:1784662-Ditylum_brightwellii.AAC.1
MVGQFLTPRPDDHLVDNNTIAGATQVMSSENKQAQSAGRQRLDSDSEAVTMGNHCQRRNKAKRNPISTARFT